LGKASAGSWELTAFKIGDDGLGNNVECPEIEAQAKTANHVGRELVVAFTLAVSNVKFVATLSGQCGHGLADQPFAKMGQLEIRAVSDTVSTGTVGPFITSTTGLIKQAILTAGRYELRIIPGTLIDGSLDDFVAASVKLEAAGLTVTSTRLNP
jgi:hypothetical protein